jgi:hypothetical protein
MLKEIKNKIHNFLFKDKRDQIDSLKGLVAQMNIKLMESEKKPLPKMADLMRDTMGLVMSDFSNVKEDGMPRHFLDIEDKSKRTLYINELAQIYQTEVWEVMCKNHIDTQGNFSFRQADGELQLLSGRMTVNGISLLRKEVKRGFEEWMDGRKAPEEFDEHETTEGININNIIDKNS